MPININKILRNIVRFRCNSGTRHNMSRVLVFDTETTGLPKYKNASIFRPDDWPHVVQLSFLLYDAESNTVIDNGDYTIKLPQGVTIEPGAAMVHGITMEKCEAKGVQMLDAFKHFNHAGSQADIFVAHNLLFDKRLMLVESKRIGINHPFADKQTGAWKPDFCAMKQSVELCKIETKNNKTGETYYKYPKLSELHNHLFGFAPTGLHDSMADILCCLRCYIKMKYSRDIIYDNRTIASLWRDKCVGSDVIYFGN